MLKHYSFTIALFAVFSIARAQNCDAIKAENQRLKVEIATLKGGATATATGSSTTQTQSDKNLTFNLTSVLGNKKNQIVTVTILVTNKGANFENYNTQVASFISDQGEEFECESAVFGSKSSVRGLTLFTNLYTNVPLKTVYHFKGVLPTVNKIKLLPLPYFDRLGAPIGKVEFRDLTIIWK